MEIRPATEDNLAAVRRVADRSWEQDYPGVVSRESAAAGAADWYDEGAMVEEVERPDAVVLVAERDADVVGFVHGVYSDGEGHLLRVYVDPGHRGEGVGSRLVEAATDRLADRGADRIRAMVLADNEPGNEFYRSLGFEPEGATYETEIAGEFHDERVWVREG